MYVLIFLTRQIYVYTRQVHHCILIYCVGVRVVAMRIKMRVAEGVGHHGPVLGSKFYFCAGVQFKYLAPWCEPRVERRERRVPAHQLTAHNALRRSYESIS